MRTKNLFRNGFWGIAGKFISLVFGFIGRTVFIKFLAAEYLGIDGLFTNVLMVMSLAELGVGNAIGYSLYKPVAENNETEISGLLNLYKNIYRIIALFILIIGICIIPFLESIIKKSSFDIGYIRLIFSLYLLQTVSSYFFAYKFIILNVNQKQYIISKVDIIYKIGVTIINVIILFCTKNFILFTFCAIVSGIIKNIILSLIIDNEYPYLKLKNKVSEEKKHKVLEDTKDLFLGKLSYTILAATDNIVISSFVSLATVGIYSNYTMIIGCINGFMGSFVGSAQAGIGNMLVSESKKYSYTVIKKMTFILFLAVSFCSVSLLCLLNQFLELWIGKKFLLSFLIVVLCVINFYMQLMKGPLWQTLSASGLFKKDKYISLTGAVLNVVMSVILVQFWGVAGVIAGTIFSQIVQLALKNKLLFKYFFGISCGGYSFLMIEYFLITFIECGITYWICSFINMPDAVLSMLIKMILCVLVPNAANYLIYRKTEEFEYTRNLVSSIIIRKENLNPLFKLVRQGRKKIETGE